jgi:hypothetical protein
MPFRPTEKELVYIKLHNEMCNAISKLDEDDNEFIKSVYKFARSSSIDDKIVLQKELDEFLVNFENDRKEEIPENIFRCILSVKNLLNYYDNEPIPKSWKLD